ncbi:hypothetical protein IEQ34_022314 [Dendrobium chrysotoxum]|uniref:Uncharacterized protein n=1 Tax=Dendrobium chrysotoxum TaxID=161865 RepID=A0AAV7FK39_DENCH|nr:hypothetical protein IEQ34_022314 [Dendrobium chrysotoxum]
MVKHRIIYQLFYKPKTCQSFRLENKDTIIPTMTLHNFIKRIFSKVYLEFGLCNDNETNIHPKAFEHRLGQCISQSNDIDNEDDHAVDEVGVAEMEELHENNTTQLIHDIFF